MSHTQQNVFYYVLLIFHLVPILCSAVPCVCVCLCWLAFILPSTLSAFAGVVPERATDRIPKGKKDSNHPRVLIWFTWEGPGHDPTATLPVFFTLTYRFGFHCGLIYCNLLHSGLCISSCLICLLEKIPNIAKPGGIKGKDDKNTPLQMLASK